MEVAVVQDDGLQVLAVHVKDSACGLCKCLAKHAHAFSSREYSITELHDIRRLPREQQLEIERRREHLVSQVPGWWSFEVLKTLEGKRLIIAGSNKEKRKKAQILALIADAALDHKSGCLSLINNNLISDAHIREFVETVKRTWNDRNPHDEVARGGVVVEYADTHGTKKEFRLDGGHATFENNVSKDLKR